MPDPPAIWILALASALSPFGMIVIVPSLGEVASHYAVSPGDTQLLIATYLFGLGVGQPISGHLADRTGRRPVILGGFLLFSAASLAGALCTSFVPLVGARFLQAVGVSAGTVGARAIVRDTHDALGAARAMGVIGAAMGMPPVIGPPIGGLLSDHWGPPAIFAFSAVLGGVTLLALWTSLAETLRRDSLPVSAPWYRQWRELLGSRVFLGYTLLYAFTQSAFFVFLAVGAPLFAERFSIDSGEFGVLWGIMGMLYVASAAASGRLMRRFGPGQSLAGATLLTSIGGLTLALLAFARVESAAAILLPLAAMMAAAGLQTAQALAGAVNCRPDIAGTAAGLSSATALGLCGLLTILSGLLYSGAFLPVAVLVAFCGVMSWAAARLTRGA